MDTIVLIVIAFVIVALVVLTVISVKNAAAPTLLTESKAKPKPASVPQDDADFYILAEDQQHGPFTLGQIRSMWNDGRITKTTQFSWPGATEWMPLRDIQSMIEKPIALTPPKSMCMYIMLGLLFGGFGVHHFYAGRTDRGVFQMLITFIIVLVAGAASLSSGNNGILMGGLILNVVIVILGMLDNDKCANGVKLS